MEAAGSAGPSRLPSDDSDIATGTSAFSVSPSSPSQSSRALDRSAANTMDTGTSDFSVSPPVFRLCRRAIAVEIGAQEAQQSPETANDPKSLDRSQSFFGAIGRGTTVNDPLVLSPNQEFDLDVIDESGGLDENIGQILKPQLDISNWSKEGYIVLGVGLVLLIIMVVLAETVDSLNGYNIDPGLSYQRHPNPLIYYKCVIDIFLALRFLLDPMLLDMGVYKVNDEASCMYLSGITQFLYLSSDCWYFAQIVDLYWSLTNPFMSVKANRRRFKIMVYSAGAFTGIFAAFVPGIHGLADGNYCWTKRKTSDDPVDRDFFHLNRGSWLLFYMWMILFYISGITVLIFGFKRLRSGLRDTIQSRRDMLRNDAYNIR
ncbi:Phosphatidylinositol-4-phosphate-5-kinase [Phytophthora megakarya]|uniref:Phosphatidylinositol-4-phosphate-5-kinase n=1 Tax=Phytophthora megakarya TaxID=4795 RepID=A0A225VYP5_9STRA|nr:Phosphatidylinositol-4-phosphate-5-kinase [Phytophthora megakarya]